MLNKLDAVTIGSIGFIIEQAESKGDEAVQADWAGTEALEFYNEFKDQELKGIPGTDLAFNELLKTHVNPHDLARSGRIDVEQGDLGWGTYRGDFIGINSDVTQTSQSSIARVGGAPIVLQGFQGNDAIYGNDQAELLYGSHREQVERGVFEAYTYTDRRYSDNDYIRAGDGNDTAYGGGGNDFIDGSEGNDFLQGDDGHDIILGGKGNDGLYGNAGNDILVAGLGNDVLTGGGGSDVFVFGANPLMHFHTNTIRDFESRDTVLFSDKLENLRLTSEVNYEESTITFTSMDTNVDVLVMNVDAGYVAMTPQGVVGLSSTGGLGEATDHEGFYGSELIRGMENVYYFVEDI